MLSQMAKEDVKALIAEGIAPSFEQTCTLNALGLLVERGPFAGVVFSAPRVAWAGAVALFEPTIQSQQWYADRATEWWTGQSLFWALAWSCANAPRDRFFEAWTNEERARHEIQRWASGLSCTVAQLNVALDYAIRGDATPISAPSAPSGAPEAPTGCPHTDLVNEALATGLGLTPERIAVMPRRRVVDILRKWTAGKIALAGGAADLDKGAKTDAYVRYDDYLISIREAAENKGAQIYG